MDQIRVTETAIREIVSSLFDNDGATLGIGAPLTTQTEPIAANPNVDPTTASTDPSSQGWVPQNRAEFSVALSRLLSGITDSEMPGLYKQIKAALAAIDSTEAVGVNMNVQPSVSHSRARETQAEAAIRRAVRLLIAEATPRADVSFSGPDTYAISAYEDEPWKVYRVVKGKRKRSPEASYDTEAEANDWAAKLRKQFSPDEFVVVDESHEEEDEDEEKGDWAVPKGANGQEFVKIAKEMGMSVMGAQAMGARAMKRFGHLYKMMFGDRDEEGAQPEAAQILILTAAKDFMTDMNNDRKAQKIIDDLSGKDLKTLLPDSVHTYMDFLVSSGELPAADVQLLKDHPGIVETLDGYPEYVRTELRQELETELVDLPNDLDLLISLDAFREYLSKYVKRSIRDAGGVDENTTRKNHTGTKKLSEMRGSAALVLKHRTTK